MVFAEARRGANSKDFFDASAGRELSADNFGLPFDTAKRRHDEKLNVLGICSGLHRAPCLCGCRNQEMLSSIFSDFNNFELGCLFTFA
ncbi:MAG: hypothetical protein A2580_13245 [Hydrogenophilales bacterium RIFOXYD1_FULL_62_11]|nr:MAG: hypothetical protein A2580_13245 [Hydrogenophilales bacterium RIFOXYD1_FULL_62_11]